MKYYANFHTSSGTQYMKPIEFTNKKEAIKYIKDVAKSEYYATIGGYCSYYVNDENGNNVEYGKLYGLSNRFMKEKLTQY